DLGQVVVAVCPGRVPAGAQLIGLARGGDGLVLPFGDGCDVGVVVLLGHAQVPDRLCHCRFCLGDVVGVVAHRLIMHGLRVLGAVDQGVDVLLRQLGDATEDALLLCHGNLPCGCG